jgi:apolipoprotein N-acyltransferase
MNQIAAMPQAALPKVKAFGIHFIAQKYVATFGVMAILTRLPNWSLAVLSPLMLSLAWPGNLGYHEFPILAPLLLVSMVPMLLLEARLREAKTRHFAGYAALSSVLFNLGTTWWVAGAHWSGVLGAVLINGILMTTVWLLYRYAVRQVGLRTALWIWVTGWIAIELLHDDWAFSFPWLNLGHAFAEVPQWVRWYAWTGPRGGTVWLLIANVVAWQLADGGTRRLRRVFLATVLGPIALSYGLGAWLDAQPATGTLRALVVQPNVDPYTEKFQTPDLIQVRKWVEASSAMTDSAPGLIVLPETFLHEGLDENYASNWPSLIAFEPVLRKGWAVVLGATTYRLHGPEPENPAARPIDDRRSVTYANSAVFARAGLPLQIYHKSKLVVGVESMPFSRLLNSVLGDLTLSLGGTSGTLATQSERAVFEAGPDLPRIGAPICWEQDFGPFAAEFSRAGAEVLTVITNDGWWGNTSGHVAHLHYARLRAVEQHRSLLRSANTGISAVIGPDGRVEQSLTWGQEGILEARVPTYSEPSFFALHGDIVGQWAGFVFAFLLLSLLVRRLRGLKRLES